MIARNENNAMPPDENQADAVAGKNQEYDPLKDAGFMKHSTERARKSIRIYAPKIQRQILKDLWAELPEVEKKLKEENDEFDRVVAKDAIAEMEAGIAKCRSEMLDCVKMLLAGRDLLVEDLVGQLRIAEVYLQQPMVGNNVE
jgi:hypothetical protein